MHSCAPGTRFYEQKFINAEVCTGASITSLWFWQLYDRGLQPCFGLSSSEPRAKAYQARPQIPGQPLRWHMLQISGELSWICACCAADGILAWPLDFNGCQHDVVDLDKPVHDRLMAGISKCHTACLMPGFSMLLVASNHWVGLRLEVCTQGVENVYTQHTPLLVHTLESLARGRLKDIEFPAVEGSLQPSAGQKQPPKLVIVFIVGGTTYEESRAISELNAQGARHEGWSSGMRLLLGGSGVLNSRNFMSAFQEMSAKNLGGVG